MGGGKSSGSYAPVVTKEQKELLAAQTDFLKNTAFPTYKDTIGKADLSLKKVSPVAEKAANEAMTMASDTAATQKTAGTSGINTGMAGLKALFDPKYEQEQVDAALQAGRETGRELLGEQNAMYGGAGGAGSSRMALADKNLQSLNNQRQATAAASARAGVQANKAAAANQLATLGGQQLAAANTASGARISYAQTPQDVLSKYASIIYGTPQGSTTPNFAGTQGQTGSSKGFKI